MSSQLTAIKAIIDVKLLRIIQVFLNKPDDIFHLNKISEEANVSLGTTFRLMKKVVDSGLVEQITVGKIKLYRTNKAMIDQFGALR